MIQKPANNNNNNIAIGLCKLKISRLSIITCGGVLFTQHALLKRES